MESDDVISFFNKNSHYFVWPTDVPNYHLIKSSRNGQIITFRGGLRDAEEVLDELLFEFFWRN